MINLSIHSRQTIRDYVMITIGMLVYTTGYIGFQLPYQITTGGAAGIGAVLFYATGFPVQYTYFLENIFLLVLAIKLLGWNFCVKTIYSVFGLTFLFSVGQEFMTSGLFTEYLTEFSPFPRFVKDQDFMAVVIGAMLEGCGLGIVFLNNGSTGGTDIIAAIVNKYRDVTIGQIMMVLDIIIITSSLFTPVGNIEKLLFGYITLMISSVTIDFILDRGRQSVQFLIISEHPEDIAQAISERTIRGLTYLKAEGWYTKNERKVILIMARRSESTQLFRIIHEIDPNAFVSQSKVIGVFGEGFDAIKKKIK